MPKIRIGFITDNLSVSHYAFELIRQVKGDDQFFEAPIIIAQRLGARAPLSFSKVLDRARRGQFELLCRAFLNRFIQSVEIPRIRRNPFHRQYAKNFQVEDLGLKVISIEPIKSPSGVVHRFHDEDIERIRASNVDVLIRCGGGILKGAILQAARFGILSFHHGDNRVNRGLPSGFWEVLLGDPSSGFVIQQLTEELDGGKVLLRGNVMTQEYWAANNALLLQKSNVFMLKVLRHLSDRQRLPHAEGSAPYGYPLYKSPSTWQLLKYLWKTYSYLLVDRLLVKLGFSLRWSVSYLPRSGLDTALYRGLTIRNPARRFLADPFVIEHEGRTICFVEDYFYDEMKGKISAYELKGDTYEEIGIVLEEEFHLSFPYVFKYEDSIYMLPETYGSREIRLYRCEDFPTKWKLEKTLMSDIDAADTMVFQHQNRWFMLSNICSANINEHHSELHVFYANELLATDWVPLPGNPVIFDSRKARNAGFFTIEDRLFRVNQVQGKAHYGKAFEVNEIVDLSTTSYREKLLSHVSAKFFTGIKSTHHFHMNEKYTVFDHNRLESIR